MSRKRYNLSQMLAADETVVVVPDTTTEPAIPADPASDPSSLDLDPAGVTPAQVPAPVPDPAADPELAAILRSLDGDTVTITEPGGTVTDIDDGTDAEDEIADETADAVNDSADDVADEFEVVDQKLRAAADIGVYGLSASGLAIGRLTGLMTGATFAGMSEEALRAEPLAAGSRSAVMSQESLISSAAEAVSKYGARALSHVDGVTRRLLNMASHEEIRMLQMLQGKIPTSPQAMGSSTRSFFQHQVKIARNAGKAFSLGDVVKNAGKAVKPGRNSAIAMAVVGAIAGTAALVSIAFKGAPKPGTPLAEMNGYFAKVRQSVSSIKWPFGKLEVKETLGKASTTVRDKIGRLFCKNKPVSSAADAVKIAKGYAVAAKEWTAQSLNAFKDGFIRAMGALKQALTGGGQGFIRSISGGFKASVAEGAGKSAQVLTHGGYIAAIFSVFALVATTLYFVVAGGCRIIRQHLS